MMGYLFISALISLKGNRRKCYLDAALKVLLGLTPVFAITGFFIAYSIQEFGNLPDSMINPVNTNNISWKLDGVLPEHQPEVAIYRTSQRTLDDCDEFANAFKSIISTEYTTISYYQDAAYYMDQSFNENGSHILQVSYTNQGFTYSAHYITPTPCCENKKAASPNWRYGRLMIVRKNFLLEIKKAVPFSKLSGNSKKAPPKVMIKQITTSK